jgi:hypothetical protein
MALLPWNLAVAALDTRLWSKQGSYHLQRKPIFMADNQRWTRRPPGSTWGDWDQMMSVVGLIC